MFATESVGFFGYTVMLLATQSDSRLRLLLWDVVGILIVSVYWVMVGEIAASVYNSTFSLISGLGYLGERWPRLRSAYWALYPFVVVSVALGGRGVDLLAGAGTAVAVVAVHQKQLRRLRLLVIVSSLFWLAFGIASGAVGQIVFGILFASGHVRRLLVERHDGTVATSMTLDGSTPTHSAPAGRFLGRSASAESWRSRRQDGRQ